MTTDDGATKPRRELFVNTAVAWGWSQASLVASVIALPILTRTLSKPELGLWTQLLALSALADLADFGMSSVFLRRLTAGRSSEPGITAGPAQFYGASSALLAVVLLTICLVPGGLVAPFEGKTHAPQLTAVVVIVPIVINLAVQPYAIRFLSRGRLDLVQLFGAGPAMVGTLATLVAAYVFGTALAVAVAYAVIEVAFDVAAILLVRWSSAYRYDAGEPVGGPSRKLWWDMIKESWGVLVISLMPQLMLLADAAVVGHVVGPAAVAIFAVAARASDLVRRFFSPFTQSLFVSMCRARGSSRSLVDAHAFSLPWIVLAGGLAAGCAVVALGSHALAIVFGTGYGRAQPALVVLIAAATLRSLYLPGARLIQADAALGAVPRWFLVGLLVHIAIAIPLTSRWSVLGTAIAVLIAAIAFEALPTAFKLRRHLGARLTGRTDLLLQVILAMLAIMPLFGLAWLRLTAETAVIIVSGMLAVLLVGVTTKRLFDYMKASRLVVVHG
jgi:O-antigen/teichoic acid export membrane protein